MILKVIRRRHYYLICGTIMAYVRRNFIKSQNIRSLVGMHRKEW